MTRLFIENIEIELNEETRFAITKQFEEISNPTIICNDWSKTVSIPFTQKNNETFNYIYNVDRIITEPVLNNLLPSEPSEMKQWAGSLYQDTTLQDGQIVTTTMVDYVRLCFLNGNIEHTFSKNYRCVNETHELEFVYNSIDDVYLEFSFIDLESDAPNKELLYCRFDLSNSGLVNGKEYIVKFSHKIEGKRYIVYDFSVKEKVVPIGIQFNPLKKLSFRLEWDNDVLMTGYAKMNEIKKSDGFGTYNITLFGELGRVFQELKKITFDESADDSYYLIEGSQYVGTNIDKNLIYQSWTSTGQTTYDLKRVGEEGYKVTDIIGFAPNNAFSDNFEYTTYQNTSSTSRLFTDVLGSGFTEHTGIEPDTVIPDGMTPRGIGEYRSYQQLPYIYWNKLFQIFAKEAEDVYPYYRVELDKDWFNPNNPYWSKLVYMLKGFVTDENVYFKNLYSWVLTGTGGNATWHSAEYTSWKGNTIGSHIEEEAVPVLLDTIPPFFPTGYVYTLGKYSGRFVGGLPLSLRFSTEDTSHNDYHLNPDNGFLVNLRITDSETSALVSEVSYLICRSNHTFSTSGYTNVIELDDPAYHYSSTYDEFRFTLPLNAYIPAGRKVGIYIRGRFLYTNSPIERQSTLYIPSMTLYILSNQITLQLTKEIRSNSYFTLNTMWDNERNLFDEILNYCKMYRIGIFVDDINRVIKFRHLSSYFNDYTIEDWTDKVDMAKDYVVKPIAFDTHYVLMNYKDSDNSLSKIYKEKYGINHGEYRLITDYNFNTSTTNMFNNITQSVTNTDNVLSWSFLIDNIISYSFPSEIYVYNKDSEGKAVNVFGAYFFHNGLASFNTEPSLRMRSVVISDDTPMQAGNSTYFYTQSQTSYSTGITTYPFLDIVQGDNMCVFNTPKDNYTYNSNYGGKKTIYSNIWDEYLNERYNVQNKIVTCYIYLKPEDYSNFEFKKFVKINNQLFIVNKIYDYDVSSNQTTKVDLITVQDINGYADDSYMRDIDDLTLSWSTTIYLNGEIGNAYTLGTFSSVTNVTFDNGLKTKTMHGVEFNINDDNNTITAKRVQRYVDEGDIWFSVYLKNKHYTTSFVVDRYSVYPYPYISITDANDNQVVSLTTGTYKLNWECTETDELVNKPSVSIQTTGGQNSVVESNDWTVTEKMYQDGDDEYFRQMYSETINVVASASGTTTITMTDVQGWHKTETFLLDSSLRILDSQNTPISEDSVEYHGLSSTRAYQVVSDSAWSLTLPQGVRSYGPTSGDAGTTAITIDWGSGYDGETRTITFTNTTSTCTLVCRYVSR